MLRRTKSIVTLQLPGIGERGESRPPNADDLLLESFNSTLLARSNFQFQYEPSVGVSFSASNILVPGTTICFTITFRSSQYLR